MTDVTFEIAGTPTAWARARRRVDGRSFNSAKMTADQNAIKWTAAPLFRAPLTGPVALDVLAVFAPPKSWSKTKTARMLGSHHAQRPDKDNIEKQLADALKGIAYIDDAQIADGRTRKIWGARAVTVVTVRALEDREC